MTHIKTGISILALAVLATACSQPASNESSEIASNPPPSREGLAPGLYDAEEVSWNVELVHAERTPEAFAPDNAMWAPAVEMALMQAMRDGAVIVDVSIDSGGCFETSRLTNHQDPVFVEHGVTHYGVTNIPSRVPRTASLALSNQLGPLLKEVGESGGVDRGAEANPLFRSGLYLYRGNVVNKDLAEAFGWPYKDLNLLLATLD